MRRGMRDKWDYDQAPQGEGIVVVHNDLGQRREVHDLTELRIERMAASFGTSQKSIRELMEAGIIK
jgi:hypothetical protein